MENVNNFWTINRVEPEEVKGKSLTVQGLTMPLSELLATGEVDSISEKIRKRMIFGKRLTINDLTDIDYFQEKVKHYENLMRYKQAVEPIKEPVKNETEPVEEVK